MTMLELRDVHVNFTAGAVALDDVSLELPAAAVTGVVGPNGAGKSTLLRTIYGTLPSTATMHGTVHFEQHDITRLGGRQRLRRGISFVPQGRMLFPSLTVATNLAIMAPMLGQQVDVTKAYDMFPVLGLRRGQLAGNLSGGEQQMLVLSRALLANPKVLLLDEVAAGLAPRVVEAIFDVALSLAKEGVSVLIAEPSVGALAGRIDSGVVLMRGRVVGRAASWSQLNEQYQQALGIPARASHPT